MMACARLSEWHRRLFSTIAGTCQGMGSGVHAMINVCLDSGMLKVRSSRCELPEPPPSMAMASDPAGRKACHEEHALPSDGDPVDEPPRKRLCTASDPAGKEACHEQHALPSDGNRPCMPAPCTPPARALSTELLTSFVPVIRNVPRGQRVEKPALPSGCGQVHNGPRQIQSWPAVVIGGPPRVEDGPPPALMPSSTCAVCAESCKSHCPPQA